MANEILQKWGNAAALNITLASLGNGNARQSDAVVTASPCPRKVRFFYKIRTGTSPTANTFFDFWFARCDDHATELRDGNVGASDAAYSGDLNQMEPVHVQAISSTSNQDYRGSFEVEDPGPEWVLVVRNGTGVALNATGSEFIIHYRYIEPEVQ